MGHRVPWVIALARGQVPAILRALPGCDYEPPTDGRLGRLVRTVGDETHRVLLWLLDPAVTLPWASSGTAGQWTILLALAEPLDWRIGPAAFRMVRRASLAAPDKIRGPWSPRAIHRARPALAERFFLRADGSWGLPWVIAGMTPEPAGEIDYDPSDQQTLDDVEPDPTVLFG